MRELIYITVGAQADPVRPIVHLSVATLAARIAARGGRPVPPRVLAGHVLRLLRAADLDTRCVLIAHFDTRWSTEAP